MICVMVLSWIMTIPHFLRVEKFWRQRLKGFPFWLLSLWPQYRGARLLWLAHCKKNKTKFEKEQKEEEETLSHIEPFLESIPQCHLTLILSVLSYRSIMNDDLWFIDGFVVFLLGFITS